MSSKSFWQMLKENVREDILREMKKQAELRESAQSSSQTLETLRFELQEKRQMEFDFDFRLVRKAREIYQHQNQKQKQKQSQFRQQRRGGSSQEILFRELTMEEALSVELMNRYGASLSWPFSRKDLTRAWRRVALITHPDRFASRPPREIEQANHNFIALRSAYQALLRLC